MNGSTLASELFQLTLWTAIQLRPQVRDYFMFQIAVLRSSGMSRAAAINFARVGAQKLWAGTVTIHAGAKTGAHHHGHLESVIYVLSGKARMRWGEKLEFVAEAGPGDFIFVPPYVPHQEINALEQEELRCVLMRSDGEAIAVNLPDLEPAEKPEGVRWVDPTHEHLPHA
jgi:uncharacterized RmlC-like cupin family protein